MTPAPTGRIGRRRDPIGRQSPTRDQSTNGTVPAHTVRPGDLIHLTGDWRPVRKVATRRGGWIRFTYPEGDALEVRSTDQLDVRRRAGIRKVADQ